MDQSSNGEDSRTLDMHRREIDDIDRQLISLLSKRQDTAAAIGRIKKNLGMEVFDPAREHEVLRNLTSNSRGSLTKDAIRNVFNEIISAARSVQGPVSVAFLGPETTFSHQAAMSLFGRSASFRAAESIEEVFGLVEKGVCSHGVVPIENSYEGSVNSTLDLLYEHELKIGAEVLLRIRHHLLGGVDSIRKVRRLYSHPMPIAQCRMWIKTYLSRVQITEVASTALAASMAAKEHDAAAVGSRLCAHNYGLNIIEENIEDHPDNVTRFLAIGKTSPELTGRDKTSILFFLKDEPGALHKAVETIARRKINMSRIESRPMKTRNWEYLFFADLEGHEQDANISDAINEMEERCMFVKRLGSYPAGSDLWE
ncbi:MAG: prephenate dehydratase [Thermodesulfobacteriota bacterium]|nr:prephenate dehydratase [Thermodesulfobacteriota bacterium]